MLKPCAKAPKQIMPKAIDITGRRFGRLIALRRTTNHPKSNRTRWECICDCGKSVKVVTFNLTCNDTKSCGCLNKETRYKHGKSYTPEYSAWRSMKQRCFNRKTNYYADYGGRGITVYQGWVDDFEAFYEHVGPRPSDEYSLDRIDVNRDYEPGNVRWATARQQARNTRCDKCGQLKNELASLRKENSLLREAINTRVKKEKNYG